MKCVAVLILVFSGLTDRGFCKNSLRHTLTLYSGGGSAGQFENFIEEDVPDVPAMTKLGQNVKSICFQGIWILYKNTNYDMDAKGDFETVPLYMADKNTCQDLDLSVMGHVGSVRFAGGNGDFTTDSITFYQHTNFRGLAEFMQKDKVKFRTVKSPKSFILAGPGSWTVYEKEDFKGKKACLKGSPSAGLMVNAAHNLAQKVSELGKFKEVRSVKKGC